MLSISTTMKTLSKEDFKVMMRSEEEEGWSEAVLKSLEMIVTGVTDPIAIVFKIDHLGHSLTTSLERTIYLDSEGIVDLYTPAGTVIRIHINDREDILAMNHIANALDAFNAHSGNIFDRAARYEKEREV